MLEIWNLFVSCILGFEISVHPYERHAKQVRVSEPWGARLPLDFIPEGDAYKGTQEPQQTHDQGPGRLCVTPWGRVVQLSPVFVVLDGRNLGSYCYPVKSFAALPDALCNIAANG